MKRIAILGSTGSIGTQALDLVRRHPDLYQVSALTAYSHAEQLFEQIRIFRPAFAGLVKPIPREEIPSDLSFCRIEMGPGALRTAAAEIPADQVLVAIVGIAGLQSVMDAIQAGRQVLLANKEADDALARLNVGHFSQQQIEMARQQLPQDSGYFLDQYRHIVTFIFGGTASANGEDLTARINAQFAREIDSYLKERIRIKTLPPVIMQSITDRMDSLYAEKGGLPAFIGHLKRHTPLSLQLKENNIADNFVLISPAATNDETLTHIVTDDSSHIQMLHLQQGVRLTDLDGFSGQRMVLEPYIF